MDVKKCIELRTSSREYVPAPISEEIVIDIINAGRWAPSPKNRQPWRFAILQGKSKSDILEHFGENLSKRSLHINYLMRKEDASERFTFSIIEQAPVLILIFNVFPSEQVLKQYNKSFDYMNVQAIGAAIQNMLLRATELGISSLWVGDILSIKDFITKKFPGAGDLVSGVVLGISPKDKVQSVGRLPITDLIIYNGG